MAFEYQPGVGQGPVSFNDWIGGRSIQSIGTNAGADVLPFQSWRHFKEAFAPELVQRAVLESVIPVRNCLDPFGGSGTTALGCQFLGVRPVTIEVNPYLADLIEAKLATYEVESIARDFAHLVRSANKDVSPRQFFAEGPPTFVEPGEDNRWIFDFAVAKRLAAYVSSMSDIANPVNRRLFRVLLGGILVGVSNIVVSGKGRRYRRGWEGRSLTGADLDEAFCQSVENAVGDILRYGERTESRYAVIRRAKSDQQGASRRSCNFLAAIPKLFRLHRCLQRRTLGLALSCTG